MYKCNDCGEIFDEPKYVEEPRGEFWGAPCSERMAYCPSCESEDFDEYYGKEDDDDDDE